MFSILKIKISLYSKEKKSIINGLSPGIEEQSEYFDATENIKDKRQEQEDDDSGVDNASQLLRESSVCGIKNISKILRYNFFVIRLVPPPMVVKFHEFQ